jgi:ribosomal protein S18 acetylase RimI-like enzyme
VPIAISVRRATPADAPALAALVNAAYAVEHVFVDGDRTSAGEIAELTAGDGVFLVLEHDGGLAAAVFVRSEQQHASIGMLSVLPALQGLGLGTRLVRIAEAMGEAMGATTVGLRIVNLREELARWYRSLGYCEVGTAPYDHRPVKRACHFVEMRRLLVTSPTMHEASAAYA